MTSEPHRVAPIIMAGVPSNIRLPEGSRATHVESDLYNIAERIRELSPDYQIALLEHVDGAAIWAITELDAAGVESLIFRVGPGCEIDALDARVIEKLNYLRQYTPRERLAMLERENAREREALAAERSERLYENFGAKMYSKLSELGFVDTPRAESIRPQNATARRHGRRA